MINYKNKEEKVPSIKIKLKNIKKYYKKKLKD
jgi:hypothetical protein